MMLNLLKDTWTTLLGPLNNSLFRLNEVEAEGKIPILDLRINHVNDKLSSTRYCKLTDTGLIMNYHALAPKC